jgi:Uma2 family endonuclease
MAIERAIEHAHGDAPRSPWGPELRQFTVDEYYKMVEAGILGERERVELIEGVIVKMPPIGPRHSLRVDGLTVILIQRLGHRARLSIQNPIRLASRVEPQPDFALSRIDERRLRRYASAHPGPGDVLLVLEVADSSVNFDVGEKAVLYAQHGIVELWVADLPGDRLLVHRDPTSNGYASVQTLKRGMTISPLAFSDVAFTIDEILG